MCCGALLETKLHMRKILIGLIFCILMINSNAQRIPYRQGDLWGAKKITGRILVEPIFEEVFPFIYDDSTEYNLARFKQNDKYGFLESTFGNIIIPPIYDSATNFNNGYAKVLIGSNEFIINQKGEKFSNLNLYSEKHLSDKYLMETDLLLDKKKVNEVSVSFMLTDIYDRAYKVNSSENVYLISYKDKKWGLISETNEILPMKYDSIKTFINYTFLGYKDNKIDLVTKDSDGIYQKSGFDNVIILNRKRDNRMLFIVELDDLWGVFSTSINKIEFKYMDIKPIPESDSEFLIETVDGEKGYINNILGLEYFEK